MQKNSLNKIAGNIHFEKQIFFFLKNGLLSYILPLRNFGWRWAESWQKWWSSRFLQEKAELPLSRLGRGLVCPFFEPLVPVVKSLFSLKPYCSYSQAAVTLQVFLTIFHRLRKTEIWLQTSQWVPTKPYKFCPTWTHFLLPLRPHSSPAFPHSRCPGVLASLTRPLHQLFPLPGTLVTHISNDLFTEAFLTTRFAIAVPYPCILYPPSMLYFAL